MQTVARAVALLKKMTPLRPAFGVVLGSGFENALARFDTVLETAYGQLPGFPESRVAGHEGRLYIGRFGDVPAIVLKGRAHYYEGHPMEQVVFPIRVLAGFGVKTLLLTNAAGGIHPRYNAGDFMIIKDHINLMGASPLRGPETPGLPRFVDLSRAYDPELIARARAAARQCGMTLRAGVYLAVSGPNYETPAEIRAFRALGADAVGMSTVPETIVARQYGIAVAGLSCIANKAAGLSTGPLLHKDVLAAGQKKALQMAGFLEAFAGRLEPERAKSD